MEELKSGQVGVSLESWLQRIESKIDKIDDKIDAVTNRVSVVETQVGTKTMWAGAAGVIAAIVSGVYSTITKGGS